MSSITLPTGWLTYRRKISFSFRRSAVRFFGLGTKWVRHFPLRLRTRRYSSYRALTFPLVGLTPTEHISLFVFFWTYHAIAITPAGSMKLVRSSRFIDCGLPLCDSQVGSCNYFFGACSAFTHVMAARSPSRQAALSIESSDSFVASAASIATGWSEPVPGRELHPLKSSAFHGALLREPPCNRRIYSMESIRVVEAHFNVRNEQSGDPQLRWCCERP
jgi:hypothetical protein